MKIEPRFSFFIFQLSEKMNDPNIHALLQPNFFVTAFGTEQSQRALTSNFFIICSS